MNIFDIANKVELALSLPTDSLKKVIEEKISLNPTNYEIGNDQVSIIAQITKIIDKDTGINKFDTTIYSDTNIKNNFDNLKKSLGELQIKILLKRLEKSKDISDLLNALLKAVNNNIKSVNDILKKNLQQKGGDNNIYYYKYMKYKIKYLEL